MNEDSLLRLGNYIRLLREAEGLSQEELAKKSGFAGRAAISAIEKGKNNLSVDRLQDIAIALHTTPGKLLDIIVEVEQAPSMTDGLSAENIARLKSYADYLRTMQDIGGDDT